METPITTPREIKLEEVKTEDKLKEYLNQFVDCYDQKLKMFLKVRSMILALNEKIIEPENTPGVNTITVTDLLNNNIDKNLKQKYMKTNQVPSLLSERSYIDGYINALIRRFCNKGLDLSNFPVYKEQKPKPMFQTLLLEIMSDNYATKKLIEKEMKSTNDSPATTIGDSPSKFFSTVSSVDTASSTDTEVMDYMKLPMSPDNKTLFSTTLDTNNTQSLSPLNRNKYIEEKINEIGNDNYYKVHSASKFWELFRDHYNENCKKLHGDFKMNTKPFGDNNTFYNQKMRNMQIIWKHVMQLKKRRQELYNLLKKQDNDSRQLPKNISNFADETIDEAKPFRIIFTEEPNPETLTNFMKEMSNAISEPNFPAAVSSSPQQPTAAAENIKVETFMKIPKDVPEPLKDVPEPPKDIPELSKENIVTEIVKILEEKVDNKDEKDPDTYFQNIRKQHYLAMEILLQYKANNENITNENLAQILELVDEEIYFVPQINVGGQETQDVYYYNNVAKYGIFDKKNVAEEFLKTSEQPTEQPTEQEKQEKILELLDWMATNIHVFVGHYDLLRENLEVIFKYIHDDKKLKIFNTEGIYTDNTNEKLIVDYLKVFIEAIKDNKEEEFGNLKKNVEKNDVDITKEENGNIVIKEKILDIDGLLAKINENIKDICEEVEVEVAKKGRKIKETRKKKSNVQEFNDIVNTVELLMCLKDKAQAQSQEQAQAPAPAQEVTEEGEQCPNIPGVINETKITEIKEVIKKLFLKLIEKARCVNNHVFTFLGKMSGTDVTFGEDQTKSKDKAIIKSHQEKSTLLRTDLWTLYTYISPDHNLFKGTKFKYSTRGEQKITEIIGTWEKISAGKHTNELIMIYQ